MLRFEDALARMLALGVPPLGPELIDLEDAEGRVLAEDLLAPDGLPLTDTGGADGYAGNNVRRRGDDLAPGALALTRGTRLRPPHLALAAALDRMRISVSARPIVTVLVMGDGPLPGSTTFALRASARRAGANVRPWPHLGADRAATERALANALGQADLVVLVGGTEGRELARVAVEGLGVRLEPWSIKVKPGQSIGVGSLAREGRRDALVLVLSDNPASALVAFGLFGMPLLRALQGDARPFPAFTRARMTRAHAHDPGLLELARATVSQAVRGLEVTTLGNQASGTLLGMARADALVCIPEVATGAHAGDEVDILLMSDVLG